MKAIVALLLLGMLGGCSKPEAGDTRTMQMLEIGPAIDIYKDGRTGCHYLTRNSGAITPRLYSDGVQVCD